MVTQVKVEEREEHQIEEAQDNFFFFPCLFSDWKVVALVLV